MLLQHIAGAPHLGAIATPTVQQPQQLARVVRNHSKKLVGPVAAAHAPRTNDAESPGAPSTHCAFLSIMYICAGRVALYQILLLLFADRRGI